MLRATALFLLRPRHVAPTAPPNSRRVGRFKCTYCKHQWFSSNVWVARTTTAVLQGEDCLKCGKLNKPFYVGRPEDHEDLTGFRPGRSTPHPVGTGKSSSARHARVRHYNHKPGLMRGRDAYRRK